MIVTVTLNPAWDVTITAEALTRGASNVVDPARRRAGGKGLNVSRVLDSVGIPTLVIAPVGVADSHAFADDLGAIPHSLVPCATPTRSTFALVETSDNATTMISERGFECDPADAQRLALTVHKSLASATCLVISGSIPPGTSTQYLTDLIGAAHSARVPVIADVSGPYLRAAAQGGADVLKPNDDELRSATGTSDPIEGARVLHTIVARIVFVSLGERGLVLVPRDPARPIWHARTPRPLRGNPTGAGDAAVAAIASSIGEGEADLALWARRAAAWSGAAVLAPLAGELSPAYCDLYADIMVSTYEKDSQ